MSEGKGGGVKMFMLPVVVYGYFLESPNEKMCYCYMPW